MKQDHQPEPRSQLESILNQCKTLQLATSGLNGPEASYAPYIRDNGNLYIFTSELASHTLNILNTPVVGIMMIQDEQDSRNIFARPRITFQCQAGCIERSTKEWEDILEKMQTRLGKTIELLKQLADFKLICLKPVEGRLVVGFGQAYRIILPEYELEQIKGN